MSFPHIHLLSANVKLIIAYKTKRHKTTECDKQYLHTFSGRAYYLQFCVTSET